MNRLWIVPSIVFLLAFGFYLHGAFPSVSAGDSGEFIAASHALGIPHASGYPTYVVLTKSFQQAIPWGNIGYQTNVFSVFCGALAVVLLFIVIVQLSLPWELAVCAALVFMLSNAHRVNSQASEVFGLHAVFCGGVLVAALANQWVAAAFLAGIGLGNHQTLLFLGPALAVTYFLKPPTERPAWGPLTLGLLGGLSIYAFLYIRAAGAPVLNAGNPDTLDRLWRVLTRADYGSLTLALGEAPVRNVASVWMQVKRFTLGLAHQVTPAGVVMGVLGIVFAFFKRDRKALLVVGGFLFIGPFFFILGNLPFDAQSTGLLERFYIVPTFYWVVLMAVGLWNSVGQKRWGTAVAFILPVVLAAHTVSAFPFRGDYRAYAYGLNNLRTLPSQALFIMDGGDDTFYSLAYLKYAEKKRLDVELHDRGGVVFPGLYGADFRLLSREEKETRRQQVERVLVTSGRTLYSSTMNPDIFPAGARVQHGMLYGTPTIELTDAWAFYDLRDVLPWQQPSDPLVSMDYRTRALSPFYAYQRSVQAAQQGQWEEALGFSNAAQAMGPDVIWLIPNITHNAYQWAQINFQAERLEIAERFYRAIAQWNPKDAIAWSDLGAIEERHQRLDAAIEDYQTAIRIDPLSEAAHYNLAVAYWKRSDWPQVIDEFKKVLTINPANAGAQNYLARAEAMMKAVHP